MKVKEWYYDIWEEKEACKSKARHHMVNETKRYVWNGIEFPTEKEMHDYIFESLNENNDIEVTTEALNKALDYNGLEFRNYVVCAVDLPNKLYIAG